MKISIEIDAIPQGRPRFYNGRVIDPPKCRKFKQDLSALIKSKNNGSQVIETPLKVDLNIYRKFNSPINKRYGDIDNLAKGLLDACTGILWKDDSQIVDLHVTKGLANEPKIELIVDEYLLE